MSKDVGESGLRVLSMWNAQKKKYATNEIITSRYTVLNFIPKNLFEQFHKVANQYFLILTCLQCVPAISITGGVPTILMPLVTVLFATALKDGMEDWRRHESDSEENNRICEYVDTEGRIQSKAWTQVQVGDVMVVNNQEFFPADLLLLASSDPHGIVYIETANLDGETNLKLKQAHETIVAYIGTEHKDKIGACHAVRRVTAQLECQAPNKMLYQFEGTLDVDHPDRGEEKLPLDPKQVLLRSCKLRNTTWALGLVIYTGPDTKIQKNSAGNTMRKTSKVEEVMFWLTGYVFLLQCVLALVCAVGGAVFDTGDEAKQRTYLNLLDDNGETLNAGWIMFVRFFTFILLFANFIPISLLVTMGIAKLFQSIFIHKDEDMRYKGQLSAPRTSDLNEELGQIDYVFTDKTGTLTCNIMEFRSFCVVGQAYGDGITEIRRNVLKREGKVVPAEPVASAGSKITPNVNCISADLDSVLERRSGHQYERVRNLLMHLAINHDVMPEFKQISPGIRTLAYSASSPDEGALVYGAKHFGFEFKERDPSGIVVQIDDGTLLKVRILAILEFSSRRKRSSVICQFQDKLPDGTTKERFLLFCKGADSVIKGLLSAEELHSPEVLESFQCMENFARDGLRTLVLAGRDLTKEEFEAWYERYEAATLSLDGRTAQVEQVAAEIEKNLGFHGITGIEDRLQDGVADAINRMQAAGIKVWMLTGDKVETAINIGVATGLLEPTGTRTPLQRPVLDWEKLEIANALEDKLTPERLLQESKFVLRSLGTSRSSNQAAEGSVSPKSPKWSARTNQSEIDMEKHVREHLQIRLEAFEEAFRNQDHKAMEVLGPKLQMDVVNAAKRQACIEQIEKYAEQARIATKESKVSEAWQGAFEAVVCDGSCLAVALEPRYCDMFVDMCKTCKTVICCRVSPEQKGSVVRTMKTRDKVITLAIGDGANDCNMIRSADVGIGLRGEEGLQAFNVCDYGISQFRFLQYLLLVHGRWAYRRVTKLVLYMFYKNIVVVGPQFFFAFTNGFSGQKLYHDVMYQSYNIFFTALPILIFGILDQDVSKTMSIRHPELYELGRKNVYFNNRTFIQWMLCGLHHAAIVFVVPYFTLSNGNITFSDGKSNDLWLIGTVVYMLVVIVANVKVAVETVHFSGIVHLGLVLSFLALLAIQAFLSEGRISSSSSLELWGSTNRIFGNGPCLLTIFVTTIIACIRDWQWKAAERMRPGDLSALHAVQNEMLIERLKGNEG